MFHLSLGYHKNSEIATDDYDTLLRIGNSQKTEKIVEIASTFLIFNLYADSGTPSFEYFPFETLPPCRTTNLLILAIPISLKEQVIADLPASNLRTAILFSSSAACFAILLQFSSQRAADSFHRTWHLKRFDIRSPAAAYVLFIDKIWIRQIETPKDMPGSPDSFSYEIPHCPLCLERLDSESSALITARIGWLSEQDEAFVKSCLVCHGLNEATELKCFSCSNPEQALWICLICGFQGCGRYTNGCARNHFLESNHRFVIEKRSCRVWDYRKERFCHKKVLSSSISVELPEKFDTPQLLQIESEDDLACLENEMNIYLENDRRKLETACEQLIQVTQSEIDRLTQSIEVEKKDIEAIKSNIIQDSSIIHKLEREKESLSKRLEALSEDSVKLNELIKSQIRRNNCKPKSNTKELVETSNLELQRLTAEFESLASQL
jgi:BRCA1-associated protein